MGGFHLGGVSKDEIEKIILSFRKLGVRYVGPCHCSGNTARDLFKKEYGKNFVDIGVGRIITHCFESLDAMYYKDNIRFLLIYPGPVDTAMLKTDKPLPCTWKPKKAAKYIVRKVLKGSTKIKFPLFWVILMIIVKLLPNKSDNLIL